MRRRHASLQQVGPIELSDKIKNGEAREVVSKRASVIFKSLQVVRFYDENATLAYLAYSDKVVDGSPKERHQRSAGRTVAAITGRVCSNRRSWLSRG